MLLNILYLKFVSMKYYCKKKKPTKNYLLSFCVTKTVFDHIMMHVFLTIAGDNHVGGNSREGAFKETVTLKWCTPRTNSVGR